MTPLEMTKAYTTFGNSGSYTPSHAITKVTDLKGKTLYKWNDKSTQIFSVRTNMQLKKLMSSVMKSGTGKKDILKRLTSAVKQEHQMIITICGLSA